MHLTLGCGRCDVELVHTPIVRLADLMPCPPKDEQPFIVPPDVTERRECASVAVMRCRREKEHVRRDATETVDRIPAIRSESYVVSLVDDHHIPATRLNGRQHFRSFEVVDRGDNERLHGPRV